MAHRLCSAMIDGSREAYSYRLGELSPSDGCNVKDLQIISLLFKRESLALNDYCPILVKQDSGITQGRKRTLL